MASFITKNFLDNEGLKAFWQLIKEYIKVVSNENNAYTDDKIGTLPDGSDTVVDAINNGISNAKSYAESYADGLKTTIDTTIEENEIITATALNDLNSRIEVLENGEVDYVAWDNIVNKPVISGVTNSTGHTHQATFNDDLGHTHGFSGSEGTTDSVNDHTHSVNVKGSVSSSFSDTTGHTHGFSGSEGTTDSVNDHTHSVNVTSQSNGDHQHTFTPAGSVSLSGSLSGGVLTITAEFTGNSLTTALIGAHTHTVSGTTSAAGGHDHDFTPTGSVNNAKATGTVTSSIDLTPTTSAAGGHDHDFTPAGSVNNAKATGTVTVETENSHVHSVEIAL